MQSTYLDAVRTFEGFSSKADWDYSQNTNGYGTKARYPGEVIDRAEAESRFRSEISKAEAAVEKFCPHLDQGTKAALTSLTFNTGTTWMHSGLGKKIKSGDLAGARQIFVSYTKAAGRELSGLVARRNHEASWIGQSDSMMAAKEPVPVPEKGAVLKNFAAIPNPPLRLASSSMHSLSRLLSDNDVLAALQIRSNAADLLVRHRTDPKKSDEAPSRIRIAT